MKKSLRKKKSSLSNLPNALTVSRVIITFIVVYMVLSKQNIIATICVFAIGALTDFFDGLIARRYNWVSEFGRKADIIADRLLWTGTALAFFVTYSIAGQLDLAHYLQMMFIMSREIVSAPFAISALISGKQIPHARKIAKATTFIQGFALPALMLSVYYPVFSYVSIPLSFVILVTGLISASYYIKDISVK